MIHRSSIDYYLVRFFYEQEQNLTEFFFRQVPGLDYPETKTK